MKLRIINKVRFWSCVLMLIGLLSGVGFLVWVPFLAFVWTYMHTHEQMENRILAEFIKDDKTKTPEEEKEEG